jgi:hypothetical protein
MNELEEQNRLLRELLKLVIEILPLHSADCGVYRAHSSYGDKYCDCKLRELRERVKEKLN